MSNPYREGCQACEERKRADEVQMYPFEATIYCPKCRKREYKLWKSLCMGEGQTYEHTEGVWPFRKTVILHTCSNLRLPTHLHYWCQNCNFIWAMETADVTERKRKEAART